MAYDETLAERVRDVLAPRAEVGERRMFGGIAFMVGGNMAVGVIGDELMVRLDPADAEKALTEAHTRPMDFTGKPMKGMLFIDSAGIEADDDFAGWVEAGADFAASLPPKWRRTRKVRATQVSLRGESTSLGDLLSICERKTPNRIWQLESSPNVSTGLSRPGSCSRPG